MDEDYSKTLSYEEKIIFLKILCIMVKADSVIDNEEINFLKMVGARYGIDNSTMVSIIKSADSINGPAEAAKITNRQHALQLIKELCVLANIDEDLHDHELDIIIDTARAMNIEDERIILINRWVLDSLILSRTGRIIMEQDNE
ncbi:MAG: hypothetical protein J6N49_00410 [Alphaproteobacteria bacterium]|nr:hypothetical protein [Alphaproteobacteria bacterium]